MGHDSNRSNETRRLFLESGMISTYSALDSLADQRKVINLIDRYGSNSGIAFSNNLFDQVAEENRILKLGHLLLIGNTSATFGEGSLLFDEDSITLRVVGCRSMGRSPAFCEMICHSGGRSVAKTLCPDHLFIPRTCQGKGDDITCEFDIRRENKSIQRERRVIGHSESCSKWPEEVLKFLLIHDPCEFWISGMRVLEAAASEDEARGCWQGIADAIVARLGKGISSSSDTGNPDEIGLAVAEIREVMTGVKEEVQLSDGTLRGACRECLFQSAPIPFCDMMQTIQAALCSQIDPRLQFEYESRISDGAETCSWFARVAKEKDGAVKTPFPTGDPARMLAMRYVRGEISREEFEEKMAVIRRFGFS